MTRSDLHYIKNYPFTVLLRKAALAPFRKIEERLAERKWSRVRELGGSGSDQGRPFRRSMNFSVDGGSVDPEHAAFLLDAFQGHRFDILGSGWRKWSDEASPRGIDGVSFQGMEQGERAIPSDRFNKGYIRNDHTPIAWHRDMKSGFRWPSDRWWKKAVRAHRGLRGVDPKVPIELGRLQHLPRIPFLIRAAGKDPTPYIQRSLDQVLDFFSHNPPGYGLNWTYSMDVGIRTMNLLVAWDLFKGIDRDGVLGESWDRLFASELALHAEYIRENLEYQDGLTGNHYIYNITGLIFAGIYLEESHGADEWLKFGLKELIRELFKQFRADGVCFEGSTAYHRFASEGILWSAALILGNKERLQRMGWDEEIVLSRWTLDRPERTSLKSSADAPFPEAFLERLHRCIELVRDLSKPNARLPQIGDNDSGRAFKLTPFGQMLEPEELEERYEERGKGEEVPGWKKLFDEDHLELYSFNALAEAFFDKSPTRSGGVEASLEYELLRSLKSGEGVPLPHERKEFRVEGGTSPSHLSYGERTEIPFEERIDPKEGTWCLRPLSGLHVFRGPAFHLTVSAWSGKGLRHTLGHVHCDRLSFELHVHGKDLIVDPGSYIYGALPDERDRFRSEDVHNIPQVEGRQQMWWSKGPMGLFFARSDAQCRLIGADETEMTVLLEYQDVRVERTFRVEADRLILIDRSDQPFRVLLNDGSPHSVGYGKKLKNKG